MPVALDSAEPIAVGDVRDHYDTLSPLYRAFWGEHIHHGFWYANESAADAQRNLTHELARRAGIVSGNQVLDVGCGLGGSALLLAEEYSCRVKGISISPKQITAASREAVRRKLQERVSFAVEDANALQADTERYDVIWTIECNEHLFDKAQFVARCAKLLHPGGRLALCTWLAGEELDAARRRLVAEVCRGMLCPSLGTMSDYVGWMRAARLSVQCQDNVTQNVARTWDLCRPVLNFPIVKTLLATGSERLRLFARSFDTMAEAYRTGAMAYGMIVGVKSLEGPLYDRGVISNVLPRSLDRFS